MKRMSVVGVLLFLGFLLAWSPAPAQAAAAPTSTSQDPAQLSTAAVVPVKYSSSSGTDTILVLNAAESNGATTATVRLRFYTTTCGLKSDAEQSLTKQDVAALLFSDTFIGATNGVVLADISASISYAKFALSAVIVDMDMVALYERQGSPLLVREGTTDATGVWGGFSGQDIDDWYLGTFTYLQFMCPAGNLATEMNTLASLTGSSGYATAFDAVNVYDYAEGNKRSIHNQTCKCLTDSSLGDLSDVIAAMDANPYGTIHFDVTSGYKLIGWRVITDGSSWWDGRLRTTPN